MDMKRSIVTVFLFLGVLLTNTLSAAVSDDLKSAYNQTVSIKERGDEERGDGYLFHE